MRIQVFWDVTLCRQANVSRLFEGTMGDALEGEGTMFLRNVGEILAR